jgi:predicted RNase H-like nuclease (RuvC/YqgF family)
VKAQAAERENWNCDKCRTEKVKMLQEELQNALTQIDELKARNRELEAKLQMAGTGERDTMTTKENLQIVWWSANQQCATSEQNVQI